MFFKNVILLINVNLFIKKCIKLNKYFFIYNLIIIKQISD